MGDIINGMQAAFIDYGEKKKGFIHLKDVLPKVDETKQKVDNTINISKVIKPNQKIMIQIKKDSDFTKGARVSTHISLPGKYIVLMPNTDFITISQKIGSDDIKKELTKFIKTNLPNGYGAIIRTSCENAKFEDIKKDAFNFNLMMFFGFFGGILLNAIGFIWTTGICLVINGIALVLIYIFSFFDYDIKDNTFPLLKIFAIISFWILLSIGTGGSALLSQYI